MGRNTELTRPQFREFLTRNADFVVGQSRESILCPIATHLTDRTGKLWRVSMRECVSYRNWLRLGTQGFESDFNTPRWARDFIKLVDSSFSKHQDILGREALQILDEAVR